jgi:hypothetical protein
MTFANHLRIARNSSTPVEGKKKVVFERFLNQLRMFNLHFSGQEKGNKKAHFRVENGQIIYDFIANLTWENAKLNV